MNPTRSHLKERMGKESEHPHWNGKKMIQEARVVDPDMDNDMKAEDDTRWEAQQDANVVNNTSGILKIRKIISQKFTRGVKNYLPKFSRNLEYSSTTKRKADNQM